MLLDNRITNECLLIIVFLNLLCQSTVKKAFELNFNHKLGLDKRKLNEQDKILFVYRAYIYL